MFEMRTALFQDLISGPIDLISGPNFSQFIHRLKYSYNYDSNMGFLSVGIMLYFQVFPNSQRDFGIFDCYSG